MTIGVIPNFPATIHKAARHFIETGPLSPAALFEAINSARSNPRQSSAQPAVKLALACK